MQGAAVVPKFPKIESRMTTRVSQNRSVPATDLVRTEQPPDRSLADAPTDSKLKLQLARRYDDGYEEGASNATAALFAGLLIGAGSSAFMIWVATLAS